MRSARSTHLAAAAFVCFAAGCAVDAESHAPIATSSISALELSRPAFGNVVFAEQDGPDGSPDANQPRIDDLRKVLDDMQGTAVSITLVWRKRDFANERYWDVARYATQLGIPIYPSLQLDDGSDSDADVTAAGPRPADYARTGKFPNATNYAAWIALADDFMDEWMRRVQQPTSLFVDMEMRLHQLKALEAAGDPASNKAQWLEHLRNYAVSEDEYAAAHDAYRQWVKRAKERGFGVQVSTLLPLLEDFADADHDLRRAFQAPIDDDPFAAEAVAWDQVNFQVHRSIYSVLVDALSNTLLLPPSFVYFYSKQVNDRFGAKASVAVGLVDPGIGNSHVYGSPAGLKDDLSRACGAGIQRDARGVFSLGGMMKQGGLERWFVSIDDCVAPSTFADVQTDYIHKAFAALDVALDP
jgi:hypothetical protein